MSALKNALLNTFFMSLLLSFVAHVFCCLKIFPLQDQLSADMYSFVAKEIDYASYFQTVSTTSLQTATLGKTQKYPACPSRTLSGLFLSCPADRSPGRVPQKVIRAASKCPAPDQSSSGWVWDQRTHDDVLQYVWLFSPHTKKVCWFACILSRLKHLNICD